MRSSHVTYFLAIISSIPAMYSDVLDKRHPLMTRRESPAFFFASAYKNLIPPYLTVSESCFICFQSNLKWKFCFMQKNLDVKAIR